MVYRKLSDGHRRTAVRTDLEALQYGPELIVPLSFGLAPMPGAWKNLFVPDEDRMGISNLDTNGDFGFWMPMPIYRDVPDAAYAEWQAEALPGAVNPTLPLVMLLSSPTANYTSSTSQTRTMISADGGGTFYFRRLHGETFVRTHIGGSGNAFTPAPNALTYQFGDIFGLRKAGMTFTVYRNGTQIFETTNGGQTSWVPGVAAPRGVRMSLNVGQNAFAYKPSGANAWANVADMTV